tara:strand:+ start:72 stop:944 length:873 start_codon:yes stop_codon:yes gene_type:complete
MLRFIYFSKFSKNILIFIPLILNSNFLFIENFLKVFFSFLFLCVLTNIVYLTNDYSDREIDKDNKLKINNNVISSKFIIILNLLIIISIILFNDFFFINFWLIFYLVSFYAYNFFLKKIFFIDLILLKLFFILRILYGAEIINLKLSFIFILFFFLIFGIMAAMKRFVQINVNKLETKNKIIAYDYSKLNYLKFIIYIYFFFSTSILFVFLYNGIFFNFEIVDNLFYLDLKNNILISNLIFIIYLTLFFRIFYFVNTNKIKIDILDHVLKDYILIFLLIFNLILIFFNLK